MKILQQLQVIQNQVKLREIKEKELAEHSHEEAIHGSQGMGFSGDQPLTVDAFGHAHIGNSPFYAHLQPDGTWQS